MNECPDRLAVAARRSRELNTEADTAGDVFARIAAEYREVITSVQHGCELDVATERHTDSLSAWVS